MAICVSMLAFSVWKISCVNIPDIQWAWKSLQIQIISGAFSVIIFGVLPNESFKYCRYEYLVKTNIFQMPALRQNVWIKCHSTSGKVLWLYPMAHKTSLSLQGKLLPIIAWYDWWKKCPLYLTSGGLVVISFLITNKWIEACFTRSPFRSGQESGISDQKP